MKGLVQLKRNNLGMTGISVTELTFGALTLSPIQANLSIQEGKKLILNALDQGINSIDTAELYNANEPIKAALAEYNGEVILGTRSAAKTRAEMEKSIERALRSLGRDYLDLFYLHAANVTPEVFEERSGAVRCLQDYRDKGYIRAIGIATHVVTVVEKASEIDEIDVIFALINKASLGIINGTAQDMKKAIHTAAENDKGIMAMKVLGGGNLIGEMREAYSFVRDIVGIHTIAVGMKTAEELEMNLRLFNNESIPEEEFRRLKSQKELFVSYICKGCGICVDTCPNGALQLDKDKAVVDGTRCILCGYCNPVCPEFAIRML